MIYKDACIHTYLLAYMHTQDVEKEKTLEELRTENAERLMAAQQRLLLPEAIKWSKEVRMYVCMHMCMCVCM